MRFPEINYMKWAKTVAPARYDLARSGLELCPPDLLGLGHRDLVTQHAAGYGYRPLREALARRYGVAPGRVLPVSGGASLANFLACAAALDGAPPGAEVIVEKPTYEQLRRIPEAMGHRPRRLARRFRDGWAIDREHFESLVNRRTRLAIVSNLHNPSGMRIDLETLRAMARILRRVGAYLLVDEVYLECLFGSKPESCVQAGSNVLATNSLTKAYGLDGLRAGWILGPAKLIRRAGEIHDYLGVNGVAPGEQMALAALRRLPALRRRSRAILEPNLAAVREFLSAGTPLRGWVPPGGSVFLARLPAGVKDVPFADRLRRRHDTLVVPGTMFEAPHTIRVSFGCRKGVLEGGLRRLRGALARAGAS
jgi:aspartate/methionine/tyrosine aminotransferase